MLKTFAERFVNDFSYFIAMTLGLVGVYKAGGLKYLGTDAAGKAKYLAEQAKVNAKNAMKGFASKTDWKKGEKRRRCTFEYQRFKMVRKTFTKTRLHYKYGQRSFQTVFIT